MIVKVLGSMDIVIAISFWIFGIFNLLPGGLIVFMGIYLLFKGILFNLLGPNFPSFLDIICGVIVLSAVAFTLPKFIVIILSIYLLQKGVLSVIS